MRNIRWIFSICAIVIFLTTRLVIGESTTDTGFTMLDESLVNIEVSESNTALELSVNFTDAINLSNVQENHQLPAIGRWVRVPDRGELEFDWRVTRQRRMTGDPPGDYPQARLNTPPVEPVVIGRPMVMRGVRVVPIWFYPVIWDEAEEEYVISDGFEVTIQSIGGRGINEVEVFDRPPSRDFDRMMDALLVNPPRRDDPEQYMPGGYLLVANENYYSAVDEFADWKHSAGHPVEILTFDPGATSTTILRDLILDFYQDYRFEHIVLFGNEDADPPLLIPFQTEGDERYYDVYFAQLEGDDPLPDATVGSFNCLTEENLTCAVRRAISYQSEPYYDNVEWFTKAGVGVGMCSVPDDLSPSYTGKWVAEVLRRRGFDDVTTSFYSDDGPDDPTPMVNDLYNNRCNFILVRAHQSNFDADEIEETGVYPFHFLVSSGTLNGAFNRAFRMGTPDDMRGPSAGFGHAGSPRTNVANALAGGMMEALFLLDIDSYGWAKNYAVANLIRVMPDDDADYVFGYYYSWRYYGDPGQWCWRGAPEEIQVEHNETIDPDATDIRIIVTEGEDNPVEGALVCLTQDDGMQLVTLTQETGWAFFTWERGDLNEEPLSFTVTGDDIYPYQGEVQVEDAEVFVSLTGFEIEDDEGGDGDGIPNAGETVDLYLILENTGDNPTEELISLTIHSFSPWARVEGIVIIIDGLEPGQSRRVFRPFIVHIADGCPDGESVQLRSGFGVLGTSGLILDIEAPSLEFADIELMDRLEPGSETEFQVYVANRGRVNTEELEGRLVSMSPFISVTNPAVVYSPIEVDDTIENDVPFGVRADGNTIPGSIAEFMLILEGDPGVLDTLYFSLPVGEAEEGDPLGPDEYGYIALDNLDTDIAWADAPEYAWLNISPWGGDVEGNLLDLPVNGEGDESVLVDLPFTFRYYGEEFEQITVCSNGWIAMGDQTELVNQQNWVMPGFDGAFGMIAVFWDRLECQTRSDGVFTYYDQQNGKFYIEWHTGVIVDYDEWHVNVFEMVLFDPDQYETPTGDSPILFMYNTVNNVQIRWEANAHCTVGISSPDGKEGLTYTYWGEYPAECAELADGRAILWTTIVYEEQIGTVSGRVTRYIDSTAVAGATVSTSNGFETTTDDEGIYLLENVEAGVFEVTVDAEGYESISEDVELEAEGEVELDFVLPHGWLVVDPDTIFIEYPDPLWPGGPYTINILLINDGNLDLEIEEMTSNSEYFSVVEENMVIGSGSSEILTLAVMLDDSEPGHYEYELSLVGNNPISPFIVPIIVDVLNVVQGHDSGIPADFSLSEPYPNPFNSTASVRFGLPKDSHTVLHLFDINGRRIGSLGERDYTAGWHRVMIDAADLPTGLYFVMMESGDFRAVRRTLLVR
ncbi:carboxypeptidase regulatory-like domain-containing protein [bacterium]|nr:carboxypeptidase regulatory-like domain-containing protein [bacterium]